MIEFFIQFKRNVAHFVAKWATACKFKGTIPISSIPVQLLGEWVEGDGSFVLGAAASFTFLCNVFLKKKKKKKKRKKRERVY